MEKVDGLKLSFGLNGGKLIDLNQKEVGAPLEPKLI